MSHVVRDALFSAASIRNIPRINAIRLSALAGGLLLAAASQFAVAAYPERPITVIISFPPAGATDVLARSIGQQLGVELKQTVVIENRPGAGGAIGLNAAARSARDGYTLHMAAVTNQAIAASIYKNQPISLVEDFVPIAGVGNVPHAVVVPTSLPVKDVASLIALLKSAPGKYNFASQGTGTLSHLESELFALKTGVQMTHIPYKGSAQALPELANGSSSMMFDSIPGSMALVQAGKLKFLAVASTTRVTLLPDVPTMAEAGVKGVEANNLFGFTAPKGTPKEALDTIENALKKVLASPELKKSLAAQGAELIYTPAAQFGQMIKQEHATWAEVVSAAKVTVE